MVSQVVVDYLGHGIVLFGLFEKLGTIAIPVGGGDPRPVGSAGSEVIRDSEYLLFVDKSSYIILGFIPQACMFLFCWYIRKWGMLGVPILFQF